MCGDVVFVIRCAGGQVCSDNPPFFCCADIIRASKSLCFIPVQKNLFLKIDAIQHSQMIMYIMYIIMYVLSSGRFV